jgi:putative heme transporter
VSTDQSTDPTTAPTTALPVEPEPTQPTVVPTSAPERTVTVPARGSSAGRTPDIPYGLRVAAAWSWRVLLIGAVLYLLARGFAMFQVLIVPVLVSLLIVALVRPVQVFLAKWLPNSLSAILTVLLTLAVVAGLVALIGQQVASGFGELRDDAANGLTDVQQRLASGPLNLTGAQIDGYVKQMQDQVRGNSGTLVSGALSVTNTAGHVATGFFIVLFSSYFFLSGGRGIWSWVVGLFPRASRGRVHGAGNRAWATLTSFIRATLIVALVDGLGVGIGAAVLTVPLALPLGVLVFLGAFVPIVGALVSGAVAVLVALVSGGLVKAAIMLGIVIAVQQVEAHVLQPFLLGRAVSVHPLAVILAIGAGVLLAGIIGALFAVPFVAVVNVVATYLLADEEGDEDERPEEAQVGPLADEKA